MNSIRNRFLPLVTMYAAGAALCFVSYHFRIFAHSPGSNKTSPEVHSPGAAATPVEAPNASDLKRLSELRHEFPPSPKVIAQFQSLLHTVMQRSLGAILQCSHIDVIPLNSEVQFGEDMRAHFGDDYANHIPAIERLREVWQRNLACRLLASQMIAAGEFERLGVLFSNNKYESLNGLNEMFLHLKETDLLKVLLTWKEKYPNAAKRILGSRALMETLLLNHPCVVEAVFDTGVGFKTSGTRLFGDLYTRGDFELNWDNYTEAQRNAVIQIGEKIGYGARLRSFELQNLARTQPNEAFQQIEELPSLTERKSTAAQLLAQVAADDPKLANDLLLQNCNDKLQFEAARMWARNLDASPGEVLSSLSGSVRRGFLYGAISQLAKTDPNASVQMLVNSAGAEDSWATQFLAEELAHSPHELARQALNKLIAGANKEF